MSNEGFYYMNRKELVMQYRTSRLLKGHRPAVIFLKKNIGKIYTEGAADFILSLGKEELYFQRLSTFTRRLLPQKDFTLSLTRIKTYHLREYNPFTKCLTLYTAENFFIEIFYYVRLADGYETEANIESLIQTLEERGVKEVQL